MQKVWNRVDKKWGRRNSEVIERDQIKILWDFNIQTNRIFEATKQDITLVEKLKRNCPFIDTAISGDHDIKVKVIDKLKKYTYF